EKKLVQVNQFVMTEKMHDEFAASILDLVSASSPVGLESVRGKVMPGINREVFQSVIQKLVVASKVEVCGDKLVRPGALESDPGFAERDKLRIQIRDILSQETCLEIEEIARRAKVNAPLVRAALADMAKDKQAAIVAYDFAALIGSIDKCHQTAADLWQKKRDIAPGEFREALGVSRKYAMALLSYLDDQQITRRLPSGRVLLKGP
ncbi:MAG: SelB C-terminal domain-containing protein, partial [Candidatus Obscuribacterales bacterium]|nr:SelB C-terminal domain-containing protein [Candidatus Obscuribacterales bacterium]